METTAVNWNLFIDQRFDDFEQLSAHVQGWDLDFHQLKPGVSPAELLQFGHPGFVFAQFDIEQAYDQRGCTPANAVTLAILEEGIEEVLSPGGVFNQDGMMYFPPGYDLVAISRSRFRGYTLTISEELLDEVAYVSGLQDHQVNRLLEQKPLNCGRQGMNNIRSQLRQVSREFADIQSLKDNAEIELAIEFDLIRQCIETLNGSELAAQPRLTNRRKKVMQRALEYIDANADKVVTVVQLAQAAGASVRTLEYVFREYYGVTPKAYLKARRLHAVRQELLCSSVGSINEIAGRWGFWHMGQFAADYRRFFGELPSETIRASL